MAVTVVGAGMIGKTLGHRLSIAGFDVIFGARDLDSASAEALRKDLPEAALQPLAKAIDMADVLVLAIPGAATESFIERWAAAIGSRVVLDASNNLSENHAGPMHAMASWQELAPDASVFRAFCSAGWETFADPYFGGVPADLFYCGPSGQSQKLAEAVIAAVGVRPVRLGDESAAGLLDALARMWFALAFAQDRGRRIAFKLLEG